MLAKSASTSRGEQQRTDRHVSQAGCLVVDDAEGNTQAQEEGYGEADKQGQLGGMACL